MRLESLCSMISSLLRHCRQAAEGGKVGQSSREGALGVGGGALGWRAELENNAFSPRSKQLETWGNFSPPLLSGSQDTEFSS